MTYPNLWVQMTSTYSCIFPMKIWCTLLILIFFSLQFTLIFLYWGYVRYSVRWKVRGLSLRNSHRNRDVVAIRLTVPANLTSFAFRITVCLLRILIIWPLFSTNGMCYNVVPKLPEWTHMRWSIFPLTIFYNKFCGHFPVWIRPLLAASDRYTFPWLPLA